MTLHETYKNIQSTPAIGTLCLSNWGGLEILDLVDKNGELAVVACFNFGTGRQQIRRHVVRYTPAGRAHIRKGGTRYYFDEIMGVRGI